MRNCCLHSHRDWYDKLGQVMTTSAEAADPDSTARRRGAKPRSTRISLNFRFKSAVHVTRPTLYKLLRDLGLKT